MLPAAAATLCFVLVGGEWMVKRGVRAAGRRLAADRPARPPRRGPQAGAHARVIARLLGRTRPLPLAALDVAEALESIARDVRSGHGLAAAVVAAQRTPAGAPLVSDAVRRMRAGDTLSTALAGATGPLGHHQRLAVATLAACAATGGPVSETIERACATLREQAALDDERRAQASQARASMWVLTTVPAGFATWSATTDAAVRAFLVGSPAGWACLTVGTALSAAGWLWMRSIVEGSPR